MQLILADVAETKVIEGGSGSHPDEKKYYYSFRLEVHECGEDNLISVITGGELSVLTVALNPNDEKKNYDVRIRSGEKGVNLLKRLREVFQDKIKISLEISTVLRKIDGQMKVKDSGDFCQSISCKGMVIDKDQHTCNDHSVYVRIFFDYLNYFGSAYVKGSYRVKIIGQIDDDFAIVPNFTMLKTTTKRILEDDGTADVIIRAGNGVEIRSHKCFLVSTSSVIKKMFENKMDESENGRIDMSDVSEEGIRAYLRFIYYGDVIGPEEKIDVAYNLLYAAHKYDVPKLEVFMTTYLIGRKDDDFDVNQAFKIYSFVKGIETASELTCKMTRIMGMHFDELKETPDFQQVVQKSPADVVEICSNVIRSLKRKINPEENVSAKRSKQTQ